MVKRYMYFACIREFYLARLLEEQNANRFFWKQTNVYASVVLDQFSTIFQ